MKNFNRAIASVLVILMLLSSLMFTLASCTPDDEKPDGGGNGGGDNGGDGKSESYSVTVVTEGGMAMAKLPIYIHEFEDGSIGEIVDNGYASTDDNGKATFTLPAGASYAAKIDLGLPEGYEAESFYPMVSKDMTIRITSSVISESSLVGVSYTTGSVIRDFTVNSTVLVEDENGDLVFENQVFNLTEALQTKKAVLINFWYTTCSWCITEFPYMQDAYDKYSDDIAIIGLDPYADDTPSSIKNFQADMGLTFNIAQDTLGVANAFGVEGYPTSVMIDRYGVITLVEEGAIPSQRAFDLLFEYYTADDYQQKLLGSVNDIVPKEKPNVEMPSRDEFADHFEKDDLGDLNYSNIDDDEYSWPFITGMIGEGDDAVKCVFPSNSNVESSYAQLVFDLELKAGDVLAFDYFASTELGVDILYVVVDGKDIYSISGESTEWETCYAYVAEEDASYEVGIVYSKDSGDNIGDDTVYLKDLRIVGREDIDRETYIYRYAATNPDKYNNYQDFVEIFLGEDGYYHVDSPDGPILLADLMGYTRFAEDDAAYYMATELYNDGVIDKAVYERFIDYCTYASNAMLNGVSSVTPELRELLGHIVDYYGNSDEENDWLRFCCYYDAYGTDGKQLVDPIKGLATFSAYDVVESEYGSTDFPNEFTYDRLIMPRGLIGKFTPTVSGTYLITSNSYNAETDTSPECDAWIFTEEGFGTSTAWLTYQNVSRSNVYDHNNCYMIAYLEAGKDYYIDIAYYDVYGTGTIKYRVERLGGEGYFRFSIASPGYFTSLESITGEFTETVAGGIDVVLGEDNIWREKRTDGRVGSILYADFTMTTPIFTNKTLEQMIQLGAFDFSRTEEDQTVLDYLSMFEGNVEECDEYLRELWGEDYDTYAELYKVQDVYNGIYHGAGKDYTEIISKYLDQIITVGYNEQLGETILEGDERIGCVVVTKELAEVLQVLMDKYTFDGVENSWRKLCYYHQYFNAATPK